MWEKISINTPLKEEDILKLKTGQIVLINGIIYTARDAAHKRMLEALKIGKSLPFELQGQVIYYAGPSPARPGTVIGSCGPTTSSRMDSYTPELLKLGLKGMIGKGKRSSDVIKAIKDHKCLYFAVVGGAGAIISRAIKESEIIAYEDLEPESVRRLLVKDFPVVVAIDASGKDIYERRENC